MAVALIYGWLAIACYKLIDIYTFRSYGMLFKPSTANAFERFHYFEYSKFWDAYCQRNDLVNVRSILIMSLFVLLYAICSLMTQPENIVTQEDIPHEYSIDDTMRNAPV